MKHLTAQQLSARHDGALGELEREAVERHLAACGRCRDALAALAEQDARLKPALTHDPGAAYFETFAARVEDRLRAAGLRGAQARLDGIGPFSWLRSPRRVAWTGAVAAVAGGAAIVILTARDVEKPALRRGWNEPRTQAPPTHDAPASRSIAGGQREGERLDQDVRPARAREELPRSKASRPTEQGSRVDRALSRDERAAPEASSLEETNAPAEEERSLPPAAASQKAAPGRLHEVRRTPAGEEVPVKPEEYRFALPPASPPAATPQAPTRVAKTRGAQPLEGRAPSVEGAADLLGGTRALGEARLCGRVLDPAGRPVAGAQVALADNARTATTDSTGRFCLASPPGDHDLTVMAIGFHRAREQVRIAGESSEMAMTLRPVSVLGQQIGPAARGRVEAPPRPAADQAEATAPSARGSRQVFAALPDSLRAAVRSAERLSAAAAAQPSPTRFEGAAVAWEQVLEGIPAGPPLAAARFALASARWGAWSSGPNATRERAARKALASFLEVASPGPDRDEATRRLERLGR